MTAFSKLIRHRNEKIEQALGAVDDAKVILAELELIAIKTAQGTWPDVGEAARLTHGLRDAINRILVGIVESATLPEVDRFKEKKGAKLCKQIWKKTNAKGGN